HVGVCRSCHASRFFYLHVFLFYSYSFYLLVRRLLKSTLFPYTTLFRSFKPRILYPVIKWLVHLFGCCTVVGHCAAFFLFFFILRDRKSTRLNSSHGSISYAVFCLIT